MTTERDVDAIRREYTHSYQKFIEEIYQEGLFRDLAHARKRIEELEEEISELIQSCTCHIS